MIIFLLFTTLFLTLTTFDNEPSLIYPLNGQTEITMDYGMHEHPVLHSQRMHEGVDFKASEGTSIMASAAGTVISIDSTYTYGRMVLINHGDGYRTRYAHLAKYGKRIEVGTRVQQGEVIGLSGNSGMSAGPHLHFEVISHGKSVDPQKYLPND
jgi:murein DD-endopeptidase MepM/ murein hydrolase activator NlpD